MALKDKKYFLLNLYDSNEERVELYSAFLFDIDDFIGVTDYEDYFSFCFEKENSLALAKSIILGIDPSIKIERQEQETVNWNQIWEDGFSPVVIDEFCAIVALHHESNTDVDHCIVINPEMSFGTGHHETTHMMVSNLKDLSVKGKRVLDFGCGTGVLAILAQKLGAEIVHAIDYDELCINSTHDNAKRNNCLSIEVKLGDAQIIANQYDIVLANVNRAALLASVEQLCEALLPDGILILSGFLEVDFDIINSAFGSRLKFQNQNKRGEWIAIQYSS